MTLDDWHDGKRRFLGMLVHGLDDERREEARHPPGSTLLIVFNGDIRPRRCRLPVVPEAGTWRWRVNTGVARQPDELIKGKTVRVAGRSLVVLSC